MITCVKFHKFNQSTCLSKAYVTLNILGKKRLEITR